MVDGQQVRRSATGGDRDGDFSREGILRQEIEEHLEESAVSGAINRSADDQDSRIQHALERVGDFPILTPAEQGVGGQPGEIDETRGTCPLSLQGRERELEQRA